MLQSKQQVRHGGYSVFSTLSITKLDYWSVIALELVTYWISFYNNPTMQTGCLFCGCGVGTEMGEAPMETEGFFPAA